MHEGGVRAGRKYGRRWAYAERYGADCAVCAIFMHAINEGIELPAVFKKHQQRGKTHRMKATYMLSVSVGLLVRMYKA